MYSLATTSSAPTIEAPPGLRGVAVAETRIGDVRGGEGLYHYGQYDATELARRRSLEEVWFFVYEGRLPSPTELRAFMDELPALRGVPARVAEALPLVARVAGAARPLEALRAALSLLAATGEFDPLVDVDRESLRRQALRLCAVVPTLTLALFRLARGETPVDPDPALPHAANYLYMLDGTPPSERRARALEQYLIATIDHGFNASTFTARVIASTGTDVAAAVIGALGALSGPRHGGAPSRALDMVDAIGMPERADEWIRSALERGERLMGFGHPVYTTEDPRSRLLREIAETFGSPRVELAKHVESRAVELLRELRPGRELHANVDFFAALVMEAVGLPKALFTPTFAASRVIGWTAHVQEQAQGRQVIRPSARYVGPPPPEPVPERR